MFNLIKLAFDKGRAKKKKKKKKEKENWGLSSK
jgi:hypothetical protein